MTIKQPLKWHGGKYYLADKIIQLMPSHVHYVEPYFGGGAVLFRKSCDNVSEVINDLNSELTNFWTVLQQKDLFFRFYQIIINIPFSENEWEKSKTKRLNTVESAVNFFIRYRQSRSGLGKSFATLTRNRTRRGMNEQTSSWLSIIDELPEIHERLKRIVILNRPAIDVIHTQDGKNTFFYLDPPYLHHTRQSTNYYEFEMNEDDHKNLLSVIKNIKGKAIISGYESKLYNDELCEWNKKTFDLPNNASGNKKKKRMTECLWYNY